MSDIPNAKTATMIAIAAQVRWIFSTADSRSDTNSGSCDILMCQFLISDADAFATDTGTSMRARSLAVSIGDIRSNATEKNKRHWVSDFPDARLAWFIEGGLLSRSDAFGVAEGEAIVLRALFEVLGDCTAEGQGCNNENGQNGDRLSHLRRLRVGR